MFFKSFILFILLTQYSLAFERPQNPSVSVSNFSGIGIAPLDLNATAMYSHKIARLMAVHKALSHNEDYQFLLDEMSKGSISYHYLVAQFFQTSIVDETLLFKIEKCPDSFKGAIPYCVFAEVIVSVNQAKQSMVVKTFLSEPRLISAMDDAFKYYNSVINLVIQHLNVSVDIVDTANSQVNAIRARLSALNYSSQGQPLTGLLSLEDVLAQSVYDVSQLSLKLAPWSELFAHQGTYANVTLTKTRTSKIKEKSVVLDVDYTINIEQAFFDKLSSHVKSTLVEKSMIEVSPKFEGEAFYDPMTNTAIGYMKGNAVDSICYGYPKSAESSLNSTTLKAFEMISSSDIEANFVINSLKYSSSLFSEPVKEMMLRIPYTDKTNTLRKQDVLFTCASAVSFVREINARANVTVKRSESKKPLVWNVNFTHHLGY